MRTACKTTLVSYLVATLAYGNWAWAQPQPQQAEDPRHRTIRIGDLRLPIAE